MRHRVETLEGALLDAAVAKAEGVVIYTLATIQGYFRRTVEYGEPSSQAYSPSCEWKDGGPIIERERIEIGFMGDEHGWQAATNPDALADWQLAWLDGPTPLIAAMRAYIASRFGEEVEIP